VNPFGGKGGGKNGGEGGGGYKEGARSKRTYFPVSEGDGKKMGRVPINDTIKKFAELQMKEKYKAHGGGDLFRDVRFE